MKNLFLPLIAAILMAVSSNSQAATISLVPSVSEVPVGASLNLDLIISGLGDHANPSLAAFDVDLQFDDSKLNLSGVSFGASLGDPALGEATTGSDASVPGNVNLFELSLLESSSTNCIFCIAPYLEELQGSSFTFATVSFQSIQSGSAVFGLSVTAFADASGDPIPTDLTSPASVQITAVPLPATLWLFAGALSFLNFTNRKSSIFSTSFVTNR